MTERSSSAIDISTSEYHGLQAAIEQSSRVVLGNELQIRQAITCILARGHLLIEGVPGVGKTTLAHTLAVTLGLDFQRIQFTSDLLPADILGGAIYEAEHGKFRFHPGPLFTQVVLADEINRATPKTQSALLEAMEERQVTVDGQTHRLMEPFFVIATQNPNNQTGTFPLPESQLDRFLMRISLGYPDEQAERALLKNRDRREVLSELKPCLNAKDILELQGQVRKIHVSDALLDYLQAILRHTREAPIYRHGLSPRAGLALLRCTQAWAFLMGRSYVMPEDIQAVLGSVAIHRLLLEQYGDLQQAEEDLLKAVPIP